MKILVENRVNVKDFFARTLLTEFLNKMNILDTTHKNCSLISHSDSVFC